MDNQLKPCGVPFVEGHIVIKATDYIMGSTNQPIKHLYYRAAFGLPVQGENLSLKSLFIKTESTPLNVIARPEIPTGFKGDRKQFLKEAFEKSRADMMRLNLAWMEKLGHTEHALQEKMVLFWHNHFACRTLIPSLAQQQNNILRKHALGSFADMLMEVSKDPAMLQFLNNQQNKKGHPNENFAREVMELFTLGRGHYTEEDIKEAARAFTGWGFSAEGHFQFRPNQHDEGEKIFRGKTKKYTGEDILEAILDDPQTARFITQKIVAYFSGKEINNPEIDSLARSFYKSNYHIGKLVKQVLSAPWFFNPDLVGNRIKTPIELITGAQQQTGSKFTDPQTLVFFQRALGQLLFYPPNVGGWPKGKEWIDSSSLAFRMAMPQLIFHKKETEFQAKDDGDVNSLREKKPKRDFSLDVNWGNLAHSFMKKNVEDTYFKIEDHLLAKPASSANRALLLKLSAGTKNDEELVKKIITGIMSLPEYQLC